MEPWLADLARTLATWQEGSASNPQHLEARWQAWNRMGGLLRHRMRWLAVNSSDMYRRYPHAVRRGVRIDECDLERVVDEMWEDFLTWRGFLNERNAFGALVDRMGDERWPDARCLTFLLGKEGQLYDLIKRYDPKKPVPSFLRIIKNHWGKDRLSLGGEAATRTKDPVQFSSYPFPQQQGYLEPAERRLYAEEVVQPWLKEFYPRLGSVVQDCTPEQARTLGCRLLLDFLERTILKEWSIEHGLTGELTDESDIRRYFIIEEMKLRYRLDRPTAQALVHVFAETLFTCFPGGMDDEDVHAVVTYLHHQVNP